MQALNVTFATLAKLHRKKINTIFMVDYLLNQGN